MDYKNKEIWNQALPGLEFPGNNGEDQVYMFCGALISASDLGNINYGAVGGALGIPLDILLWQGGAMQLKDHKGYWLPFAEIASLFMNNYGDEEDDRRNIEKGYILYKEGFFS